MSESLRRDYQTMGFGLALHRESMDVAGAVKQWASRIAASASIGPKDRQWLYDLQRDRVSLAVILRLSDLATAATIDAALYGPMALRGCYVREIQPVLPVWTDAWRNEEDANHAGNLAQLAWAERRSSSNGEAVRGTMNAQALYSMVYADAVTLEEQRRITVVGR